MIENKIWYADYYRTTDDTKFVLKHFIRDFIFQHRLRYIIYFRKAQSTNNRLVRLYCNYKIYAMSRKYGIEIKTNTKIGKGFCMTHPYNITVSPAAVIGENVTMMKGSTIGIAGGSRKGAPTIGNMVYIGLNSTVLGNVTIGDNVLIAPNTMVNIDVPSNSIALGSPCKIIPKDNPTKDYIWKTLS